MAAPSRYPAAHEQLLRLAQDARREGLSFEEFWERAVRPGKSPVTWQTPEGRRPRGAIIWPRDTNDRNVSIAATTAARGGWRRAYEGLPAPRREAALVSLSPSLELLVELNQLTAA